MLNGWLTVPRKQLGARTRIAASGIGAAAALAMGIVGCTSITGGTATVDTAAAPAYRVSMSESAVTSSVRESQRQESLTTQVVRGSCGKFASSSNDAVDAVNRYVAAFNNGGDIAGAAGPAVDALNRSADEVSGSLNEKLSDELRETFTAYADAARSVADAISSRAPVGVYNARKDQLNSIREKGMGLCRTY